MRQLNMQLYEENLQLREQNDTLLAELEPKKPEPEKKKVIGLGHVEIGGLVIAVTDAEVRKCTLVNQITQSKKFSQHEQLVIELTLFNNDEHKEYHYETWAGECLGGSQSLATLCDNLGKSYKRVTFGVANVPLGRVDAGSVTHDEPLKDMLIFAQPYAFADELILKLPGSNLGLNGEYEIRFPMKQVKRP